MFPGRQFTGKNPPGGCLAGRIFSGELSARGSLFWGMVPSVRESQGKIRVSGKISEFKLPRCES